jgi:hypothetical protein
VVFTLKRFRIQSLYRAGSPEENAFKQKSSPPHALARNDEGCSTRLALGQAEKFAGCNDDDQQGEHSDQIDLTGIVPVVMMVEFPAHGSCPPGGSTKSMRHRGSGSRLAAMRVSLGSGAAESLGCVDAAPAPEAPRQIPSRAIRFRQRHIVDSRSAPGLTTQQPRQRHPAAAPQAETCDRLVGIDRTGRQMPAVVSDQRRQRVPVDPDHRTSGVAGEPLNWAGAAGTMR